MRLAQGSFRPLWQIVPTRLIELLSGDDAERAQRVMACMMEMGKLDIAALEAA